MLSHESLPHPAQTLQPKVSTEKPYLRLEGITKTFSGFAANSKISLSVFRGEVHALLGENGAGKSTLMKILYGYYRPDSGTISIDGTPVEIRSPDDALRLGIGMVFQKFMLIPAFTVLENISLGLKHQGAVKKGEIAAKIREVGERYGLWIDPEARVRQLSIGEQQRTEIIRLLLGGAKIVILDEPTSALAPPEVDGLFEVIRKLKEDGHTILFITHKLKEVKAVADRITVLRRGAVVGAVDAGTTNDNELVRMMLGDRVVSFDTFVRSSGFSEEPCLELRQVAVAGMEGRPGLKEASLKICPGEIFGIAGVAGNGQVELGEAILGLQPIQSGQLFFQQIDITSWSTRKRLEEGFAYIPEDPLLMGVAPRMTVQENMILNDRRKFLRWSSPFGIDPSAVRLKVQEQIDAVGFPLPKLDLPAAGLSGGNLQRIVFTRELARSPRLVIAFCPTRGMDLAAARFAHQLLMESRNRGAAVLLISEDLDELLLLSDRLAVLHQGQVAGTFNAKEFNPLEIGLLMTGGAEN
jgi:simple sugar transport system ATP-binding protein